MIGVDAMESTLVRAGIAEGWLPNMRRLLDRGRSAALHHPFRGFPGSAWPTTITGTTVSDHGATFDSQLRGGSYDIADLVAEDFRRPPFWRFISDAGLPSTISSVYSAGIIRPFNGTQVTGWGTYDPFTAKLHGPSSEPPEALELLRREFPRRHSGFLPALPRSRHDFGVYRRHVLRQVEYQSRALAFLLDRTEWSFFFGAFPEPHEAGHLAWHLSDPSSPKHPGHEELLGTIMDVYRAVDAGVGLLMDACPSDAVFCVMTPHGMGPLHHTFRAIDGLLEAGGWYKRGAQPGAGRSLRGSIFATAKRVTPFELRWAVGRHRSRARWSAPDPFVAVDWTETQAFPLPSDGISYVRVNLEDREPLGSVSQGEGYDGLRAELAARIHELVDPATGSRAAAHIHNTEELTGSEVSGGLPDLVVEWRPELITELHSDRLGTVQVPMHDPRTGDHTPEGFLLAAGPEIQPIGGTSFGDVGASILDIGPTVLSLLGLEVPDSLPGEDIGLKESSGSSPSS